MKSNTPWILCLLGALGCWSSSSVASAQRLDVPFPLERQILWQRTLEDAQAIARAQHRPILIAVNMDGESASERIVRERYHDPAFVALTRSFVCLPASVFRHSARDHDDAGRRIVSLRFGEVTSAEHVALEPLLYDKFLGGERIAPRHAVILPDGTKAFDLSLLFDFKDLDAALADAAKNAPPPQDPEIGQAGSASARSHRGRLAFEERLADPRRKEGELLGDLAALEREGDAGSIEALRILLARSRTLSAGFGQRLVAVATSLKLGTELGRAALELCFSPGAFPGAPELASERPLFDIAERLLAQDSTLRRFSLALEANDEIERRHQLRERSGQDALPLALGSPADTIALAMAAALEFPASVPDPEEVLDERALERELTELEPSLSRASEHPEAQARYGQTALKLARLRQRANASGTQLLLEDAKRSLEGALARNPNDVPVLLAAAETAYRRGDYDAEQRFGHAALGALPELIRAGLAEDLLRKSARATAEHLAASRDLREALRWIGDGKARALAADKNPVPGLEAFGASALQLMIIAPEASDSDWLGLASFYGLGSLKRAELAVLEAGADRLPESQPLREALNSGLWNAGRIDLAPFKAEWIAGRHLGSAASAWYAAHAWRIAAEQLRRDERPEAALDAYTSALRWLDECVRRDPKLATGVARQRALDELGRGFAQLLADRREEASEALARGIVFDPGVAAERDGLDREAIDLLDGALEWRASGPSPVDPEHLLELLAHAAPADPAWPRAIADSEVREARRAYARKSPDEGDGYLRHAIVASRRARALLDDEAGRRDLAQACTMLGEAFLVRGELDHARTPLHEAAEAFGLTAPEDRAALAAWQGLALKLREQLGEAAPKPRPGR